VPARQTKKVCPSPSGGKQLLALDYTRRQVIYIPALTNCGQITQDPLERHARTDMRGGISTPIERYVDRVAAMDPIPASSKAKANAMLARSD